MRLNTHVAITATNKGGTLVLATDCDYLIDYLLMFYFPEI